MNCVLQSSQQELSSHCSGSIMHALSCNGREQATTPGGQADLSPREMDELLPKLPSNNQLSSVEAHSNSIQATDVLLRIHTKLDLLAKMLSSSRESKGVEEKAKTEWRLISMVLDRMFLIVFVALVFFTFVAMFSQIPS